MNYLALGVLVVCGVFALALAVSYWINRVKEERI